MTNSYFDINWKGVKKLKQCKIINLKFTWVLIVDNEEIPFQSGCNANYFKNHYESLGYKVEMIKEN